MDAVQIRGDGPDLAVISNVLVVSYVFLTTFVVATSMRFCVLFTKPSRWAKIFRRDEEAIF